MVPAVGGPGVVDEVPDGDDGVGQGDERLDHSGAHLGTDLEPTEAAGVPGVGAFDHPAPTGPQGVPLGEIRASQPSTSSSPRVLRLS